MHLDNCEVLTTGYSYHSKPFQMKEKEGFSTYLIRIQTEGSAYAIVNHRKVDLLPGDTLLIKPGEPYELFVGADDQASEVSSGDYYIFCRGNWLDRWWERNVSSNLAHIPLDSGILTIVNLLALERRRIQQPFAAITDYLLRTLCLYIERSISEQAKYRSHGQVYLAYRMKSFIEEHATTQLKLEDVAAHVGLSVSRVVHLFKEVFGQSIIQYTMQIRLHIARERILFSPMTLEQVAESAGFQSYSYFHRQFRARFGMSPKQFRQSKLDNLPQ